MEFEPIPGPRGLPIIGNIFDIQTGEPPVKALERLADIYGPIYQLTLGRSRHIVVSSAALMKETLDEKRFLKTAIPGLHKDGKVDGLIVAGTLDPDWEQGHRILRPAFGPLKLENMFHDMDDITGQMLLKWARFGPNEQIYVTDDFSNLTLDVVALSTMAYRFNSFYRDGAHPYVAAMNQVLAAAAGSASRNSIIGKALALVGAGPGGVDAETERNAIATMASIAQGIIDERRSNPGDKDDFLNLLLFGKDPKTGEVMRDELIAAQMQSFLTAGHETTSGLLSFTVLYLLQNPETLRKAQEEVDRVVGTGSFEFKHIKELKYIYAVLQEALRLAPTAPLISKIPHPDVIKRDIFTLDGKYKIEPTDRVRILFARSMQDPTVFGKDSGDFNPDRFLETNPDHERIEPYWRPFSEGARACLGRPFSMQEAVVVLTRILQNFDLRLTDPLYNLRIVHNITIKPLGLYVKASLRHGMAISDLERRLQGGDAGVTKEKSSSSRREATDNTNGPPLTILFGSNQGTCQALAQRLASEASSYGFNIEVADMDASVGRLSKEHPTVIVTASYEGEPPDNALQFVSWLESLKEEQLDGVKFAVFGCGNKDWHSTFHRIPKLVDSSLKAHGAKQIAELGLSDVSGGNPMADFEAWMDESLLPQLKKLSPKAGDTSAVDMNPDLEVELSTGERVATLRQELQVGTVKEIKILTAEGVEPEKRHMEIELPLGSTYECGDYLAILPQSPEVNVRAVMAHFKLPTDATIKLKSQAFSPLPLGVSLSVADLLRSYYELAKPATRRALTLSMKHTSDEGTQKKLTALLQDEKRFHAEITETNTSVFDILTTYPQIEMPFAVFLSLLPPLGIRQYSISSSPLRNNDTCTITYGVVADEKDKTHPFYGVATTYLATLKAGDHIQVGIRSTAKKTFRLPLDSANTPLLMFGAGTGLAPFRGFIEQRAIQLEGNPNTKLAPAHLFLGCRYSDRDRLYAEEIDEWEKIGAVTMHYAFSQEPEKSDGCVHVTDRMLKDQELLASTWLSGARAYVCGNRDLATGIRETGRRMVESGLAHRKTKEGLTSQQVEDLKAKILTEFRERAADDVFN